MSFFLIDRMIQAWLRMELDGRAASALGVRSRKAKHRSQWPVLGWVTKIYYLELLRASEGT
jgi:hypothetical protein